MHPPLFSKIFVNQDVCAWQMATPQLKEGWRCVSVVHGPHFIHNIAGIPMLQTLPASKCLETHHVTKTLLYWC